MWGRRRARGLTSPGDGGRHAGCKQRCPPPPPLRMPCTRSSTKSRTPPPLPPPPAPPPAAADLTLDLPALDVPVVTGAAAQAAAVVGSQQRTPTPPLKAERLS